MKYYLICDESGRLGYTDKTENQQGEFSVVAGAIIPHELFSIFGDHLCGILKKYTKSMKSIDKFHITDLKTDVEQHRLRQDIYDLLVKFNIPLVYGALYLKPFTSAYETQQQFIEESFKKQNQRGITIDKNMQKFKKLLQAECFSTMYTKSICELIQFHNHPVELSVITDEVDNKTLYLYQDKIDERHLNKENEPLKGKRYHQATKEIERFSFTVNTNDQDPRNELLRLSSGKISKSEGVSSIVADVIANSVNHYLSIFVSESKFGPLNSMKAIENHPLSKCFIAQSTTAIDKIYAYKAV
ncbi:MAG: hypothetical protein ACJAXJ_004176 [Colwellia sp.]|jgi:hypothetical protein